MKVETLIQELQKHSQSSENPECIILCELQETPLERQVRLFYEEYPYHKNPPSQDLQSRIEELRRDWTNWAVPVTLEHKRTLDVGCGCGFNLALHGALASVAVGIDVSLDALRRARQYAIANGVSDKVFLIRGDVRHLDLPDGSFDLITCVGVLHHIPDHVAALANMARLLDTGGVLLSGVYHPGGRFRHRLKRKALHAFSGHDLDSRVKWARRLFNVSTEARHYAIPEEIYVRDAYAVPVEKAFSVARLAHELNQLGLILLQVRPSPATGFASKVEDKARRRWDQQGRAILVDAKAVDRELSRTRRHHYWCLAQKTQTSLVRKTV